VVILGERRLGVIRWSEGLPRLAWFARETVGGWVFTEEWDRIYHGQFISGGGEELVLSDGLVWLTLAWDPDQAGMSVVAVNASLLSPGPGAPPDASLELRRGHTVVPGRFLRGRSEGLLVLADSTLSFAAFDMRLRPGEGEGPGALRLGFKVASRVERRAGDWPLAAQDLIEPMEADGDDYRELLLCKADLRATVDLGVGSSATSRFLRRLDEGSLAFLPVPKFRRGDVNNDGVVDISDATRFLGFLFLSGAPLECQDAADANDSGKLDLADVVFLLSFLFLDRSDPPEPGPSREGCDPTTDALGC
jgi:hypothetical protein